MSNQRQRVEKLEQQASPAGVRVVWAAPTETEEEAIGRAGDYRGKTIVVRWQSPADMCYEIRRPTETPGAEGDSR
jgi:hypothetical protein